MSSVVLSPLVTTAGPSSLFPLFGLGGNVPEGSLGDSINKATLKALDNIRAAVGISGFVVDNAVATPKAKDVSKSSSTGGNAPSGGGGGGGMSRGSGAGDDKPPAAGRPARLSDFKTALKIGATGAAVAGAGLAVNETAKQLGQTANDAVATTGEVIKNISDSVGKGLDSASQAVGDALSPITDPLGLSDPETRKNIGGLVIGVLVVGIIGFGLFMVMSRK
ncbi:hypothetical protein NTE_03401 [Candidatus Nitrososphaera evergladensis SR1]|uniref:Uncharacterized protein n=1 Tax=Candidatus Nitrososphaera evergladensis SR1 TaxID=1459636 RepID=A0A075N1U7_9ARCH|nr:hypothetical protein [Candidatus Nitrososphaera evergladensis]AIF85429.1 hypothetical protein NTE_03401 [Candidatus Nitrososphaera evergladensis SR1]